MTNEELEIAAKNFAERQFDYEGVTKEVVIPVSFKAGAYWALNHQWINVEDILPENDDTVLVITGDCPYVAWFNETKKEWHEVETGQLICPTHWMKIPELKTIYNNNTL